MKKAFTMLELIFVLVVIGILAAVIIPSTRRSPIQEAAIDLQSQIRYVQHLNIIDDKFDATNSTWMANRWQIVFSGTNNDKYSITRFDIKNGTVNTQIYAKNPQTKADMQNINLKNNISVVLTGSCEGQTNITFDNFGRPMTGDISDDTATYISGQLLTQPCIITLSDGSTSVDINISQETGYARIIN